MIKLNLRALSVYGEQITNSLKASEPELQRRCSCPPGESFSVEITELPGRRFEAIVTRPRPVMDAHEWAAHVAIEGMYRRLFDKRTSPSRIREAVAEMVAAPLEELGEKEAQDIPTVPAADDLKIVLVDSATLQKTRYLMSGCQICSPYAEIPFGSILDRVTGHDPAMTQYVLADGSAKCPRCGRQLDETTLVEFKPPRRDRD